MFLIVFMFLKLGKGWNEDILLLEQQENKKMCQNFFLQECFILHIQLVYKDMTRVWPSLGFPHSDRKHFFMLKWCLMFYCAWYLNTQPTSVGMNVSCRESTTPSAHQRTITNTLRCISRLQGKFLSVFNIIYPHLQWQFN